MKFILTVICLLVFTFSMFAQKADEVLATAANKNFTAENLKPEAREMWLNLPKTLAEKRKELFEKQIGDNLLELEAGARKISVEKLYQTEIAAKVADSDRRADSWRFTMPTAPRSAANRRRKCARRLSPTCAASLNKKCSGNSSPRSKQNINSRS